MEQENPVFSEKQQYAFDLIINEGKSVFITGPAGCGKTFLLNMLILHQQQNAVNSRSYAVTAMTGIAATLLPEGRTLHSWAGVGLAKGNEDTLLRKVRTVPKTRDRWRDVRVIIVDEVSMLTLELFEKLEYIARKIRSTDKFFGGIQLVLCGDFCQLPPVGSSEFCFQSPLWKNCIDCVYLDKNFRQENDDFQNMLNEIRLGTLSNTHMQLLKNRLKQKIVDENGILPTRIYPTNAQVDIINEREVILLKEDGKKSIVYYSKDVVYDNEHGIVEVGLVHEQSMEYLEKSSLLQKQLELCEGSQVMLLVNYDMDNKLANGSRGVVTDFVNGLPKVMFRNNIECIIDYYQVSNELPYSRVSRTQIPLKLAWAVTVHKSQGMTLDYVVADLGSTFISSQIYVTLSRIRSLDGLFLEGINFSKIGCHPAVKQFYDDLASGKYKKENTDAFSLLMKNQCAI